MTVKKHNNTWELRNLPPMMAEMTVAMMAASNHEQRKKTQWLIYIGRIKF